MGQKISAKSPAAFTITELLVVIAIIGILAAMLLPVVSRGKSKSLQTECSSNLRQVSMAVYMFASDNSDTLPGPSWQGLYYTYNQDTERLLYYLTPYLGLSAPSSLLQTGIIATCPASLQKMRDDPSIAQDSLSRPVCFLLSAEVTNGVNVLTHPFGYPYSSPAYRLPNAPDEPPKKLSAILSPAGSWAMVDADQQNAFPGGLYFNLLPVTPVHGVVRNTMYFDWHVEAVKAE